MRDKSERPLFSQKVESALTLGMACLASLSFSFAAEGWAMGDDGVATGVRSTAAASVFPTNVNLPEGARGTSLVSAERDFATAPIEIKPGIKQSLAHLKLNGRIVTFTAAQSKALFEQSERLADLGAKISVRELDKDTFVVQIYDHETGYVSPRQLTILKRDLRANLHETERGTSGLLLFLDSFQSRGSLLLESGSDVGPAFYQMSLAGTNNIPLGAVSVLMKEGWTIAARKKLTPHILQVGAKREERCPSGRCVFSDKRIELAEYFGINGAQQNSSVASLYHEVGHVLFNTYVEKNVEIKGHLAIALERDLAQLGALERHIDKHDPDLPLKLYYYGTVTEGFAESCKDMFNPGSGNDKIMARYFPNFYAESQELVCTIFSPEGAAAPSH